ncbi:hypothetical protein [Mesorhizobium sp.]|uniref:hypothetical protein n=1 Tax=Mesorhizobium sp. TaxID=1871066 RepID=UPI002580BC92|nr:hypothetical protein [Mesorhizobium sp.]
MLTKPFFFDGNDFRDCLASKELASLLQRLPNLSEHDAGRPGVSMKLCMDIRPQGIEHFPTPVGAARQPMDSLGSLHDLELAGAVRAKVILNKRTHAEIDDQQAARLNAGLAQPRECNMRSVGGWLPAQVHSRVNTPGGG